MEYPQQSESQRQKADGSFQGLGEMGSCCLMGTEFQFCKMWLYLRHWTVHLKMVNFIFILFIYIYYLYYLYYIIYILLQ